MTKICVPVECERITHGGEPTSRADPLESCHLRLLLHQPSNRDAHCNILAACTGTDRRTCRMTDPESSVKGQVVKRKIECCCTCHTIPAMGSCCPGRVCRGRDQTPAAADHMLASLLQMCCCFVLQDSPHRVPLLLSGLPDKLLQCACADLLA